MYMSTQSTLIQFYCIILCKTCVVPGICETPLHLSSEQLMAKKPKFCLVQITTLRPLRPSVGRVMREGVYPPLGVKTFEIINMKFLHLVHPEPFKTKLNVQGNQKRIYMNIHDKHAVKLSINQTPTWATEMHDPHLCISHWLGLLCAQSLWVIQNNT